MSPVGVFETSTESPQQIAESREDSRPQQFKATEAWLHAQRERTREVAQNWSPSHSQDVRDLRSPELLGETLLRMQTSLGSLAMRQDLIEGLM